MAAASCAGTEAPRFRRSRLRKEVLAEPLSYIGKNDPSFLPWPHQIRSPCPFAHSSRHRATAASGSPRLVEEAEKNDGSSHWRVHPDRPSSSACRLGLPQHTRDERLEVSPTNCLTSTARTSAGSIWLLRNSTTRRSSGGISSAMKIKRTRPAWRFVFACCQKARRPDRRRGAGEFFVGVERRPCNGPRTGP